jgi:flavin-dependent dehydrogenase
VVAFGGTDMMGVFFAVGGLLHVRIISAAFAPPATIDSLVKLISGLQGKDLIEGRLELNKAKAAIWHPPGGMALELEMHTAKRTMLVGTAGGFASATTGQTLDPSVRSALVAADVADKALHSRKVQEAIWQYKNQWREKLAQRIRPSGTSLQMLLPMVLSNKAIMGKFAKAFLYGKSL